MKAWVVEISPNDVPFVAGVIVGAPSIQVLLDGTFSGYRIPTWLVDELIRTHTAEDERCCFGYKIYPVDTYQT